MSAPIRAGEAAEAEAASARHVELFRNRVVPTVLSLDIASGPKAGTARTRD